MQLTPTDASRYQAVASQLDAEISGLPHALRALAAPALERLVAGEFSRLAALLPWWLAELAPLDATSCAALAQAGLWAWWHGQLLDDLLDGEPTPASLPLAQHAQARALDGYAALGLLSGAPWQDLAARLSLSAAAYAEETRARPVDPATVSNERLAAWTPELLMDRAAPFGFAVTAQLHLAGVPLSDRRHADLSLAVRYLTGARQIADDASDWIDDLRAGQLNWVAAGLIGDFRTHAPAAEGHLERLAGYELRAEHFWEAVEQVYAQLSAQALVRLEPYGPCRLSALIEAQQAHDLEVFGQMRARRADLRALFGQPAVGIRTGQSSESGVPATFYFRGIVR
jgi:hypothetical protein